MKASIAALAVLLIMPVASAGYYGSPLQSGDVDFFPTATATSKAISINEADFGVAGQASDNCILLDTGAALAAGAQNNDIRLTPCFSKAAGTKIADADSAEKANAYPNVAAANVQYADLKGNGKYDAGDYVYLTTQPAPGLAATGATGMWTIRLTPVGNLAAGTFVRTGDPDWSTWSVSAVALPAYSYVPRDDSQTFLVPVAAAGIAKYGPIPAGSVKLLDSQSVVTIDATDFTVTPASPTEGQPFVVSAVVKNTGKVGGIGLLTTTLSGAVVDSRGTPPIAAGKNVTMAISLFAATKGVAVLKVGTFSKNVTILENPLQAQIAQLTTRLTELEEALDTGSAKVQGFDGDYQPPKAVSPGAPVEVVFLTVLVAFVLLYSRRRRQ